MKFRLLLISALTLIATPMWASDQQDKPTIIIDPDPSAIVLESGRSISSPHGLITTTIYGDGRVRLSNEAKRQPQYFEMHIGVDEVEGLLQKLETLGFFEITTGELKQLAVDARVKVRGPGPLSELIEASDLGGHLFSVRLKWFQEPGTTGVDDFEHALVISGPWFYAEKYPEVVEFQELLQGVALLMDLEKDERLQEVGSSSGVQ